MATDRSTVEVLRAARERISDPQRWTQAKLARDGDSRPVKADSPTACRWCALGALQVEGVPIWDSTERRLLELSAGEITQTEWEGVAEINDGRSGCLTRPSAHRLVLSVYDRAIELAEAQGA